MKVYDLDQMMKGLSMGNGSRNDRYRDVSAAEPNYVTQTGCAEAAKEPIADIDHVRKGLINE